MKFNPPSDLKWAVEITGSLSVPSKMPCYGYGLPAWLCKTGSKLRDVKDSVCNKCYALKGFYVMPIVKLASQKRYDGISDPKWVEAMTALISRVEKSGYFRMQDSGDIKDVHHFQKICELATNLPNIKFWLPTKEIGFISEYVNSGKSIPKNLIVRLSAFMMDSPPPTAIAKRLGVLTSSVRTDGRFTCPASKQNNECKDCRKCWDSNVRNVSYHAH